MSAAFTRDQINLERGTNGPVKRPIEWAFVPQITLLPSFQDLTMRKFMTLTLLAAAAVISFAPSPAQAQYYRSRPRMWNGGGGGGGGFFAGLMEFERRKNQWLFGR